MMVGLGCALGAALAYGIASILESAGIRRSPQAENAVSAIRLTPTYYLGLGLDGLGFVAAVVALQFLPLFLVQAIVAASVAVTAVIAALRGSKLGRAGWLALGITGVGLVMLGLSAAAEDVTPLPLLWRWVLLVLSLPICIMLLVAAELPPALRSTVCAVGAGLGFSVVAIASRGLDIPDPLWRIILDPAIWAVLASGGLAVALFTVALEAGSVTAVSAITFSTETVIPAAVGLAVLGDSIREGFWPLAIAGFVLAVIGSIVLAKFAEGSPVDSSDPPVAVA